MIDADDASSEMLTVNGFIRAQTHERTTDLTMLNKIVYEKRNVNQLVEDELDEFRKEIESKFALGQTKGYIMPRDSRRHESSSVEDIELVNQLLIPQDIAHQVCSRIALQDGDDEENNEYALALIHKSS